MATVGAFNVALAASVARFVAPVRNAERTWASLARTVQRGARTMEESQRRTTLASIALARQLTRTAAVLGATATGLTMWGLRLEAQFEQTRLAFETLLGSADEAREFLAVLERFARRTPFAFEQLVGMSRAMLAWGFARQEVEAMLGPIGDFVASMGGGQELMDRVIRALGQIRARGVLAAQEMLQLTEAGVPAWEMLAERIGVDIPTAMQLVSRRAVPAALAIDAVLQGLNRRFAGSMERQARTLLGRWEQAKDAISIILRGLGADVIRFTRLGDRLARLAESLGRFADVVSERGLVGALRQMFPPWLTPVVVGLAGAVGGMLVPAVLALARALRTLAAAQAANLLLMGKWAIIGAAVGVAFWALAQAVGGAGALIQMVLLTAGAVAVSVLSAIAHAVGLVIQAVAFLVPALQGAADAVINWALQQRDLARQWLQTAFGLSEVADSADDAAESGQRAASVQEALAQAIAQLNDVATDNIQAFDEVHQLQQAMEPIEIGDWPILAPPTLPPDPPGGAAPPTGGVDIGSAIGGGMDDIIRGASGSISMLTSALNEARIAATLVNEATRGLGTTLAETRSAVEESAASWRGVGDALEGVARSAREVSGQAISAPALTGDWEAPARQWQSIREALAEPVNVPALRAPDMVGFWAAPLLMREQYRALEEPIEVAAIEAPALSGDWQAPVRTWEAIRDALVPIAPAPIEAPALTGPWDEATRVWGDLQEQAQATGQVATEALEGMASSGAEALGQLNGSIGETTKFLGRLESAIGSVGGAWQQFVADVTAATQAAASASGQGSEAVYRLATSAEVSAETVRRALSGAAASVQQSAATMDTALAQASQGGRTNLASLAQQGLQWLQQLNMQGQLLVSGMVAGILGALGLMYTEAVGHSIIPDMVNRSLKWLGQLRDQGIQIIDQMTTRIGLMLSDAFTRWVKDGLTFQEFTTQAFQAVGDAALRFLAEQISMAVSQGLTSLAQWVVGMLPKVGAAIGAFIQQAYAALLAFFAWSGPLAPALAAGVIAAGMAGMAALARQAVSGIVGLAEGGIVTGPTFAMLGENRRREMVIPLERDNVIAESVGDAVYEAMVTALRGMAAAGTGPAGGQPAEIVLRIDSTEFARVALPALEREAERRGMRLLMRPAGAM